jgi:NADPH:quinone reductase-like Zn-dependent oxidoreductase
MLNTMQAAAIDRFGGIDEIKLHTLPVPEVGPDEVLIHVESAGVGAWDPFEREGGFAEMYRELHGAEPEFPYILGSEGAGRIEAVGEQVDRFKPGDRVYAGGFLNPKGGFYAQYAAVKTEYVSHVPDDLSIEQAGVTLADGITALRGLDDQLQLKRGESVMIFGASGGIGHMAVQLAKRMGARVLGVASGDDGVALAQRLGADAVANGRKGDVAAAARKFAPDGLDAALFTAGGDAANKAISAIRDGGRIAFPTGVEPEPQARPGVKVIRYDGDADADIIDRFNRLIEVGSVDDAGPVEIPPFEVTVARTFPLRNVVEAHRALETHFLGKIALLPT